jgi:hypothetical protein
MFMNGSCLLPALYRHLIINIRYWEAMSNWSIKVHYRRCENSCSAGAAM